MSKDIRVPFPLGGIHEGAAYSAQPPSTTSDAQNVTGMDPVSGRARGAQRAGMSKFNDKKIGSKKLSLVTSVSYDSSPSSITAYASGSEVSPWSKTLPGKGSVWCMVTDSANNVYVVDSGSTIVKYNPTGYQLYTFKVPVKDEGHEVRAITIDPDAQILYVGVSTGGAQSTAHIFALEEIEGTSGQYLNKIWEYKTSAYANELLYVNGKLYAALNDNSLSKASIIVLSGVGTAVPVLERSIEATYPVSDMVVSPKDGGLISTSPINTQRGGDRIVGTSFTSPRSVDWDPTKLEGYEKRIWSWLDASDIDGDGTYNESYSDGEEILTWTDKSGNGRSLEVPAIAGVTGPLLSKAGFGGVDCLSFSNTSSAGAVTNTQMMDSQGGATWSGNPEVNANNPQNLCLFPTHAHASYAIFMVVEAIDDGANSRALLGKAYNYWDTGGSSEYGVMRVDANCSPGYGRMASSGYPTTPNPSSTASYSPKSMSLQFIGEDPNILGGVRSGVIESTNASVGTTESMPGLSFGDSPSGGAGVDWKQPHPGTSSSGKFIISSIVRTGKSLSGGVVTAPAGYSEPLMGGASAVQTAGYATTNSSYYRINGQTKASFAVKHMLSGSAARLGGSIPPVAPIGSAQAGFKGRVCEIIVLKEWYYRQDETSQPVRLNVCSCRPVKHTVADHGEYSGIDYSAQDPNFSISGQDLADASRIYEAELIEGYLAHKWGISDHLPNSLVGHIVMNASAVPTSGVTTLTLPNGANGTSVYTFQSTASGSGTIRIISGAATDDARIIDQANEIAKAINGDPGQLAGPIAPNDLFCSPPYFILDTTTAAAANKYAVMEVRTRSSMATSYPGTGSGFAQNFATSTPGIFSFPTHNTSFTNSAPLLTMKPNTKLSFLSNNYGINYSIHPFAEHRRQVHKNSTIPVGWVMSHYRTARTLGGPPRSDGKRKFQPAQVLSSGTQNIVKYDKDSGQIKWARYNASPEGIPSGLPYTNYGGIGFGLTCNLDGIVFTSGQRAVNANYPIYTEQTRLGLNYPADAYDFRAVTDNGASIADSWYKQASAAVNAGLDSVPGWSKPVIDAYGNFVCPLFDQDSVIESLVVFKASDGTEVNKYTSQGDSYPLGLSVGASTKTITLPSSFSNPRSEFLYLGSRVDNVATVTFSSQPAVNSTITITDGPESRTYTFVTSPSSANQVAIGGNLPTTILNLVGAINGGVGTYGSGTVVNASVSARQYTISTILLSAKNPEPSGGTGVFTFSGSASPACNATMGPVTYKDATLRRINLITAAPSGVVGSYRSTKNIAIDGMGLIYWYDSVSTFGAVSGTQFSASNAQFYDSAVLFQKLYITNGFQVLVYDPVANTTSALESKQSGSPTERWALVSSWRGRLVLGRGLTAPHNWIMSAIGDPTNWDLFPPIVNPGQAVAGTASRAGLVPDVINAIIPYNDDLLLFGGDRSIFRMTGDPMSGGQMDLVTDVTGIAFGRAWDKDPQGYLYFLSSRGALFVWPPGGQIVELSLGKFEQRLASINFSKSYTQLIWNDVDRTLHIMTFPLGQQTGSPSLGYTMRHFRYERDSKAFWEDTYGQTPTCAATSDSDSPNDRVLMIGCLDNYVRKWDNSARDDDGVAIDSYVTLGPFGSQDMELRLSMLKCVLADNQSGVNVQLFSSDNPDSMGDPMWAGKLDSGSNPNLFTRVRGSYFWIKLRNSFVGERWAFESLVARVNEAGRKRI